MSSILIRMTSFYFYTIFISEHYRAIVGYSPKPGQQVGAILWNITIAVGFISQIYRVNDYFDFVIEIFTSQKYRNTLPSYYFVVPGTIFWTSGFCEGLPDCCKWGRFIVGNWPVLLWQSRIWYSNHPIHELKKFLGMWRGHK